MKIILSLILLADLLAPAHAAQDMVSLYGVTQSTAADRALLAIVGSVEISTSSKTKADPSIILNGMQRRLTVSDADRVHVSTITPTGFYGTHYGDGSSLTGIPSIGQLTSTAAALTALTIRVGAAEAKSSTAVYTTNSYSNPSWLTSVSSAIYATTAGSTPGDNMGNHIATTTLQMGIYGVNTSSSITAGTYQINGQTILYSPNTTGNEHTLAIGRNALSGGIGGQYNVAVGDQAGQYINTGYANVLMGLQAGRNIISGYENVVLGTFAGMDFGAGDHDNTVIGYYSGLTAHGDGNIFIGSNVGNAGASYNQLKIGSIIAADMATSSMTVLGDLHANRYYGDGSHLTGVVSNSSLVKRENPNGIINGVNTEFYLAHLPVEGSEEIFVNGLLMGCGAAYDYTIFMNHITFNAGSVPKTGWSLRVNYNY